MPADRGRHRAVRACLPRLGEPNDRRHAVGTGVTLRRLRRQSEVAVLVAQTGLSELRTAASAEAQAAATGWWRRPGALRTIARYR